MAPGIPTKYNGTTYRSRTEARWAVFLDLLGIGYEYEPFDANGYIPDFVLIGGRPLLLEVKPDVTLDDLATYRPKITSALRGVWKGDIMIVGSTPFPEAAGRRWNQWGDDCHPSGGLMGEVDEVDEELAELLSGGGTPAEWSPANEDDLGHGWTWDSGMWHQCRKCGKFGWFHSLMWFAGRPCGHNSGDHYLGHVDRNRLGMIWDSTRDKTRWEP